MKNTIKQIALVVLGIVSQLSLSYAQDNVKVKGGFKSCISCSYEYKFGNVDLKSKIKKTSCKYDNNGNNIEVINYNDDGSISEKTTYKYDIKNNLIEFVSSSYSKSTYSYDSIGNITEEKSYATMGYSLNEVKSYKYNTMGNLIQKVFYNSSGEISGKETYTYDNKENLINLTWNCTYNLLKGELTNKYNLNGNLIETIGKGNWGYIDMEKDFNYDKNGMRKGSFYIDSPFSLPWSEEALTYVNTWKIIYIYDGNGNLTEQIIGDLANSNTPLTKNIFKNDTTGKMIECKSGGDYRAIFKYDNKENLIEYSFFNDYTNGSTKKALKYDNYNNLIEEITYDGLNEPMTKTEYIYLKY